MRRMLAAEPALWMPTISASTRVRSACPVGDAICRVLGPISTLFGAVLCVRGSARPSIAEPYLDKDGYRWYCCHSVSAGCSKHAAKTAWRLGEFEDNQS
jgi:hypothetical protein